jgi:exonuclease III
MVLVGGAGSKLTNSGLRLDYFLVSECMVEEAGPGPKLHDAWIMSNSMLRDPYGEKPGLGISDHCPVAVELSLQRR